MLQIWTKSSERTICNFSVSLTVARSICATTTLQSIAAPYNAPKEGMTDPPSSYLIHHALERFYKLFDSVYRYIADFGTYLEEMSEGVFVQHSIEVLHFLPP